MFESLQFILRSLIKVNIYDACLLVPNRTLSNPSFLASLKYFYKNGKSLFTIHTKFDQIESYSGAIFNEKFSISDLPNITYKNGIIYPVFPEKIKFATSNNFYIFLPKTSTAVFDDRSLNPFQQLATTIALPNTIDLLKYKTFIINDKVNFEIFGNSKIEDSVLESQFYTMPTGSTLILTKYYREKSNLGINEELFNTNLLHYSSNPIIQFLKFIVIDPMSNFFIINTVNGQKSFASNYTNFLEEFDDQSITSYQDQEIEGFIKFINVINKDLSNKETGLSLTNEVMHEVLLSGLTLEQLQTAYLPRFKELLLFKFIIENKSSKIQQLIDMNVDINAKLNQEICPLHQAVSLSNNNILKILIKAGADLNCVTPKNETALYLAVGRSVLQENDPIIETLLNAGSNISYKSYQGYTPLTLTMFLGKLEITKKFLKHAPNLETKEFLDFIQSHSVKPEILAQINAYRKDPLEYVFNNNDKSQFAIAIKNIKSHLSTDLDWNLLSSYEECINNLEESMCYLSIAGVCKFDYLNSYTTF